MYKIIQWATGNVGASSLRSIVATPEYELVGAFVYNPEKAGKDIGELCGIDKVGVLATCDPEEILAMDADLVVFNALGDTLDPQQSENMICRLLESGKNVVSTAVSVHIHPRAMTPATRARIEAACQKGGVTFHSSGINPGFTFDLLPIALSVVSDRIDNIHCVELVDMATYSSERIVHHALGMGKRREDHDYSRLERPFKEHSYGMSALFFEDAFGIKVDDGRTSLETIPAEKPVQCPWGVVEAGTTAALRMRLEGIVRGKTILTWDIVWRVTDDVAPDWPKGGSVWEVKITGEPNVECRIDTSSKKGRTVSLVTSMLGVNTIPEIIKAEPGIKTRLDLPLMSGGRFNLPA